MFQEIAIGMLNVVPSVILQFLVVVVLTLLLLWATLMRPLGWNLRKLMYEFEEDQNLSVGLSYLVFMEIATLAVGLLMSDGFSFAESAGQEWVWIISTVVVSLGMALTVNWIFLKILANAQGENVRKYLHREVEVEDNAGIISVNLAHVFSLTLLFVFQLL